MKNRRIDRLNLLKGETVRTASKRISTTLIAAVASVALLAGCSQEPEPVETGLTLPPGLAIPTEHKDGEALFNQKCATCHGKNALGTKSGPPLIHQVYEPNHHSDDSFQIAVAQGSRAHHWNFGDMPAIQGVSPQQVDEITGYIRFLQQQAGVF